MSSQFITVTGVSFKHTGLMVVVMDQMYMYAEVLFVDTSETSIEIPPQGLLENYCCVLEGCLVSGIK